MQARYTTPTLCLFIPLTFQVVPLVHTTSLNVPEIGSITVQFGERKESRTYRNVGPFSFKHLLKICPIVAT